VSEYVTFAALKASSLEDVLERCIKAAEKINVRFEVPSGPTNEAHTWVGVFANGWVFALADPGVWELLDVFNKVARDTGLPCLTGTTEGDFRKWTYEYQESGTLQHQFCADPSLHHQPNEYDKYKGDAAALARVFDSSLVRLRSQVKQFQAPPVHEFLDTLGFDVKFARRMRFVVVTPGRLTTAPSTLSVVLKPKAGTSGSDFKDVGRTTKAFDQIFKAMEGGHSSAASLRAARFGSEGDFNEVHDLFMRLRKQGQHDLALPIAEELVARVQRGDFSRAPQNQREVREASIYGLRGMALHSLGRVDEAIQDFQERALSINRYIGPLHRASIAAKLGGALVAKGRFGEALDPLRLCLSERPLHAKTWANLARAALKVGNTREARQAAILGIAADPSLPQWEELRRDLRLTDRDILPPRKPQEARSHRREAQQLMRAGDKVRAVDKFRVALHQAPTDIDCAWGVACALAECIREGLIPMDPNDLEVIRLLEQVAFANPTWPWSWATLVEMLDKHGLRERAQQALYAYSQVHATRLEDLEDMAIWLAGTHPELGVQALRVLLDRFVDLRLQGIGSSANREQAKFKALAALGKGLTRLGRAQEALQPLTDAAQIDAAEPENLLTLAEAHAQMGNLRAAMRATSRGLKVAPDHVRLRQMYDFLRAKGLTEGQSRAE
jgi:tetratricopeptide (TPR) repeat protein